MNDVLAALLTAPAHVSPAVALYLEAQRLEANGELGTEALLGLRPRIDAAIAESAAEAEQVENAVRALCAARPAAARTVPAGF